MSPPLVNAALLASLGRSIGMLALLVPIVAVAVRAAPARHDRAFAAGTGLAVASCALVIIGLILSSFSAVRRDGWLAGLGIVDLAIIGIALRRGRLGDWGPRWRWMVGRPSALGRIRVLPAVLGITGLAIATSSVVVSISTAQRQARRSRFTQLWMLPTTRGGVPGTFIGVTNFEGGARRYRLVISIQGRPVVASSIRVAASDSWTGEVPVPRTPHRLLMSARLYRSGDPTAYRETSLWTPAP